MLNVFVWNGEKYIKSDKKWELCVSEDDESLYTLTDEFNTDKFFVMESTHNMFMIKNSYRTFSNSLKFHVLANDPEKKTEWFYGFKSSTPVLSGGKMIDILIENFSTIVFHIPYHPFGLKTFNESDQHDLTVNPMCDGILSTQMMCGSSEVKSKTKQKLVCILNPDLYPMSKFPALFNCIYEMMIGKYVEDVKDIKDKINLISGGSPMVNFTFASIISQSSNSGFLIHLWSSYCKMIAGATTFEALWDANKFILDELKNGEKKIPELKPWNPEFVLWIVKLTNHYSSDLGYFKFMPDEEFLMISRSVCRFVDI